jgi:hypothetical protein
MTRRFLFLPVLLALTGVAALAGPVLAASQPTQGGSSASTSSSSTTPGGTVTFSGTFKDNSGSPVVGSTVTFSQQAGPCAATFSSTTGTTNSNGTASTQVTLPCAGQFTLAATNQGVTVTAAVSASAGGGGFPNAAAAAPAGARLPLAPLGILVGLALVAASIGGFAYRRGSGA